MQTRVHRMCVRPHLMITHTGALSLGSRCGTPHTGRVGEASEAPNQQARRSPSVTRPGAAEGAARRQTLCSRAPCLRASKERGLAVRTRAGWARARGPSGVRRARQLARARRARERARGSRVRARARLQLRAPAAPGQTARVTTRRPRLSRRARDVTRELWAAPRAWAPRT